MIKSVKSTVITNECYRCGKTNITDVEGRVVPWNSEFQEWESFRISCQCGNKEILNLNTPLEEADLDQEEEREVQKQFIREIIKMIRQDFVE
ncbi:hypothetical protein [Halobacillus sp. H74]|uniref:hypothetical protein n=1 Tax=Halobacillus sp. H74 TaxID=3457436 RepID=UPI003FCC53E3